MTQDSTSSPRIVDRLLNARAWLLAVAAVIALAAWFPAQRIEFNRSIENMFAANDPIVPPYKLLKQTFGGNEIVLVVYEDPELLAADRGGMERLAAVSERLRAVPGVRDVLSLDRPIGPTIVDPDNLVAEKLRQVFEGYTHSQDGRMAAAVCLLDSDALSASASGDDRVRTIAALRTIAETPGSGLAPGMIAGEPVMVIEGFRSLEVDGRLLATWSTSLVALVIFLCFRSLRWVAISLAVVQWTLWLTYGSLYLGDVRLTLVSGMLSAIVTVVGIATTVHVLIAFRDARTAGLAPRAALADAARRMAGPVLWSLVTDAAGFGSLMLCEVGPVRDFGLMTTVGSLLVLPALVLLTPGLALLGTWDSTPRHAWGEGGLGALLRFSSRVVERHSGKLAVVIGLLVVVGIIGLRRTEVETDFTRNFRPSSSLVRSYETIESRFGGAGVLDVIIPAPESLTWDYLSRVLRLEERLRTEVQVEDEQGLRRPGLTKVLSAADAIRAASPADIGSLPFEAARDLVVRGGWETMRSRMPAFATTLYAPADAASGDSTSNAVGDTANEASAGGRRHWYRIMLRARERQPAAAKTEVIAQVERIVGEELAEEGWGRWKGADVPARGHVTGYFVLLTNLISSTVRDQWTSFGVATLGVLITLLVGLRNWKTALIALAPNALPIVVVLGTLGWLGLKLNLGAAMIAAVSMGLSVDSSIHYLMAIDRRRREGMAYGDALHAVQQEVGRAVVFSTLALVVGFLALCGSEFMPTVYFGMLVSLAMCGGLAGNLILLPLLLRMFIAEARITER